MRFREIVSRIDEVTRPKSIYDASQKLIAAGYDVLGSGAFGRVFRKPGSPHVVKLFSALDTSYLAFIALAQTHPSPHFPKFIGKVVRVTDDYYAVRTEPLTPYRGDSTLIDRYIRYRDAKWEDPQGLTAMQFDDAVEFMEEHPTLRVACDLLKDHLLTNPEFRTDLHNGNIMMRGSTMVLSDPVALSRGSFRAIGPHIAPSDRRDEPQSPKRITPEMQAEIDRILAELGD